ncbi:DUF1214 domain-containing protein [Mycolicibacterium fortuitum]|uniref:DUF1254 domain-containing protein n=1 Tax=Mycolicibacterium fortuitum subsp. fortuitum DSM 46621 = ATCC 6841 = JCM 6387 TaxID=1214102 RepID=K0VCJ1_MYCFO|nr:DUF1254 domain-containing protein [Mycolicibacterium fortuitum]AIY45217.1 hypothetical protein G155_06140 [Mycobacterium sp. VKM Ac-1817D]CRL80434.1 hypothetical protein CPGR_03637 [Mycolicibacter nonchromogenicus]EJZ12563.1 hypothetical protein MFORT_17286 [Mycolicibacterium fortuitum subsp. fortuitum DSM 46621 = ATCC 6841 = JCM 6387]MCA4721604.1 DUF1254 domain-containing protein [Mycolicibacterium fortuitum]WEV33995.1 DUF1254 domain-containing protein [Mycolicibacterium fortuitum]
MDPLVHARAVQAVIWGMPAVNFELLREAAAGVDAGDNQVVFWSKLLDWKNQTLTPNPDTLYFFPFYNTQDGPVVLEIPPAEGGSITGSVDNSWQEALEDVGPAGADKGDGGRYLILPPGFDGAIPDGYIVLPSATYTGFGALRANIASSADADVAAAAEYGKRIKCYPLAQPDLETRFVDASETLYDSTIPYNLRFFELLDQFVQREPWLQRDRVMISVLASIGIEQGKLFEPDDELKRALEAAAVEAHEWFDTNYPRFFTPPYFDGTHWALPASPEVVQGMQTGFADPTSYPVDDRGLLYSFIYFSAKHLGQGQFYVMTIADADGAAFDGAATYRLRVPADPPVSLYWSATAYDRATHALIRDQPYGSRSSHRPDLGVNPDGSVDVYFGPVAIEGQESNWIPTNPDGQFEVLFRLYGPKPELFDNTWALPDIEKL